MPLSTLPADPALLAPILTPGRAEEARRLAAALPTARAVYAELQRREWLTPLQARWLSHGRVPLIGQYLLLERLGRGGMGSVHLARHRFLGRLAALKTTKPGPADPDRDWERFRREAEGLARADHPNVVHAYDAGMDRGFYFLAMEYVAGPTLKDLLASGPVDPGLACEYGRQAALGLAHLHSCGVIHRDVKPGNVAVTAGGVVKVLDLGLSRTWGLGPDGDGLTRSGVWLGSPDYVPPEQVLDPRRAGPRADQYALGCTLYHLIGGDVPYPGGSAVSRARRHLRGGARRLDEVQPGLPAGLSEVVGKMMARRAKERYRTMEAAGNALAAFAVPGAHPIPARLGETDLAMATLTDQPTRVRVPRVG